MTDAVWQIEKRRRELNLSKAKLASLAGISGSHYSDLVGRKHEPRRATIAKLKTALARHAKGEKPNTPSLIYRLCLVAVCQAENVAVSEVLAQEPSRRATFDPVWKQAADIRGQALYLAHVFCGVPQAQLAAAAGLTNAAVSLAMNRIEDACEPDDEPLFQLVETAIGGL